MSEIIPPTEVTVWPFLLDRKPWAALWSWLRACDRSGSGWVTFRLQEAATSLARTHQTVRSHLKRGQDAGWFRSVTRVDRGTFKVYLSGFFVIAQKLGLDSLGPVAQVPVRYLRDPKRLATDLSAEELQAAARQARIRELKGQLPQTDKDRIERGPKRCQHKGGKAKAEIRVPTAFDLLTSDRHLSRTSVSSTGGNQDNRSARGRNHHHVLGKGTQRIYLHESTEVTGVSQQRIGEYLGRAESTIRRRLSNSLRCRLGRQAIEKRQAVQRYPIADGRSAAAVLSQIHLAGQLAGGQQLADSKRFYQNGGNQLWYCLTNLYWLQDVALKHARFRRSQWRKIKLSWGRAGS